MSSNPLDEWRQRSKFNVEALEGFLFDEEVLEFKKEVWRTLTSDPLFCDPEPQELSLEKKRQLTFQRLIKLSQYNFLDDEALMRCPMKFLAFSEALQALDGSLLPVHSLNVEVNYLAI